MHEDDRLKRVLQKWEAPAPRAALDDRVLASYRREKAAVPWWKRKIPVPAPVLLGLVVVLAGLLAWRMAPRPLVHDRPAGTLVAESGDGARYTTVGDFSGFQPAKEPALKIERRKQ